MTYRVEFEAAALVQLNGLPSAAFDALVERVTVLVQEPWMRI
jgi:chloramphenicol 3-O-phosphotransferase